VRPVPLLAPFLVYPPHTHTHTHTHTRTHAMSTVPTGAQSRAPPISAFEVAVRALRALPPTQWAEVVDAARKRSGSLAVDAQVVLGAVNTASRHTPTGLPLAAARAVLGGGTAVGIARSLVGAPGLSTRGRR